jgi:2-iminobutanoate/2-iminopropanoate deaminase
LETVFDKQADGEIRALRSAKIEDIMAKRSITTVKVAGPLVPLSSAVKSGNRLFVSGTTPFDREYKLAQGDFPAQMRQTMENLKAVLEAGGSSLERVVKVNVILRRIADLPAMNEIYRSYFKEDAYPARTTIEAKLPHEDFLLEIERVAEIQTGHGGRGATR